MRGIKVRTPGFLTTVQDLGRVNAQSMGFPVSGALDQDAAKIANQLVANSENTALLEYSLVGPELEFQVPTFIAITGAQVDAQINGKPIRQYQVIRVAAGDVLKVGSLKAGRWGYIAVRQGIKVPLVFGSAATTIRLKIGGFHGRKLTAKDLLPIEANTVMPTFSSRKIETPNYFGQSNLTIRLLPGPQIDLFSQVEQSTFFRQSYQLSDQSDRMGSRLDGEPLQTKLGNLLSEATVLGGIQITPSGEPIVLLADRQTTGGYPVIAIVTSSDLSSFVQAQIGTKITFKKVDLATARKKLSQHKNDIDGNVAKFQKNRYQNPVKYTRTVAQRVQSLF